MLLGHVASLDEDQAYVRVGYTQVRSFKWKAKQGKLRSVVELVESSRVEQQDKAGLVRVLGTSYLTHPRRRTSKVAWRCSTLDRFPVPRAAASSAIVSSLTPSPLYSLPKHPAVFLPTPPSSDHCNESLHTRRDNTAYTEHTFPSCRPTPARPKHRRPEEAHTIPAVPQPTTHSQPFTCRLPRPVLLLGATLLRTKASAIPSAVE